MSRPAEVQVVWAETASTCAMAALDPAMAQPDAAVAQGTCVAAWVRPPRPSRAAPWRKWPGPRRSPLLHFGQ